MKLIDLIELLFKSAPVQFEPCPWNGPVPESLPIAEYYFPTTEPGHPLAGHHIHYAGMARYEWVSPARIVSVPAGYRPLFNSNGDICGGVTRSPERRHITADLISITVGGVELKPFIWPERP